jgi:hypothetical protein
MPSAEELFTENFTERMATADRQTQQMLNQFHMMVTNAADGRGVADSPVDPADRGPSGFSITDTGTDVRLERWGSEMSTRSSNQYLTAYGRNALRGGLNSGVGQSFDPSAPAARHGVEVEIQALGHQLHDFSLDHQIDLGEQAAPGDPAGFDVPRETRELIEQGQQIGEQFGIDTEDVFARARHVQADLLTQGETSVSDSYIEQLRSNEIPDGVLPADVSTEEDQTTSLEQDLAGLTKQVEDILDTRAHSQSLVGENNPDAEDNARRRAAIEQELDYSIAQENLLTEDVDTEVDRIAETHNQDPAMVRDIAEMRAEQNYHGAIGTDRLVTEKFSALLSADFPPEDIDAAASDTIMLQSAVHNLDDIAADTAQGKPLDIDHLQETLDDDGDHLGYDATISQDGVISLTMIGAVDDPIGDGTLKELRSDELFTENGQHLLQTSFQSDAPFDPVAVLSDKAFQTSDPPNATPETTPKLLRTDGIPVSPGFKSDPDPTTTFDPNVLTEPATHSNESTAARWSAANPGRGTDASSPTTQQSPESPAAQGWGQQARQSPTQDL